MDKILDSGILPPVFTVSGPSGVGKDTLTDYIISLFPDLFYRGVSMTSRKPRLGEVNGVHYWFVSEKEFRQRIEKKHFIEWKEVHGNLYGTLWKEFRRAQTEGKIFLFDLDVNGSNALKCHPVISKCLFRLFITISDHRDLYERILKRSGAKPVIGDDILSRVATAKREMERAPEFDAVIVNDDLARAKADLLEILSYFLLSCRVEKFVPPEIEEVIWGAIPG